MNHKVYIRSIACQTRYIPPQPQIIPALIGAAAVLGSSFIGASQNSKNLAEQRRINKENFDFQREMFAKKSAREDALNANSALIQRQSLEKAGLNPNIGSYGPLQTAVSEGSPSSQAYAGQNPLDGGALASLIQNQPLVDAQVKNINADTSKKVAETENTQVDTVLKNTQSWQIQQLTPAQKENMEEQSKLFKQEAEKARVSVPFIQKQIEKCQSEIGKLDVETSWLLDSYDSRLSHSAMEVAVLQSQNSLNVANAAVAYKSLQVMSTQMRLMESEISLNGEKWIELNTLVNNLAIDGNFKQFELELKKRYGDTESQKMLEFLNEKTLMLRSEQQWRPLSVLLGFGNMGMNMVGAVK